METTGSLLGARLGWRAYALSGGSLLCPLRLSYYSGYSPTVRSMYRLSISLRKTNSPAAALFLHPARNGALGFRKSLSKNRPYHGIFRLSDDNGSGLVTLDVFRHTLNMLGAKLTPDEAQMVADRLAARTDGLVDYEGLYRMLLETPPPQVILFFKTKRKGRHSVFSAVPTVLCIVGEHASQSSLSRDVSCVVSVRRRRDTLKERFGIDSMNQSATLTLF